ncbi:hypothetical protein [uncultured Bdellovibrio sp.]|uniref:hypothetical protein n=1 Tax=Bdellovibrio sp. HCB-162 TaxID=3394234 RepID=UPI0025DAAFFD|nr:hypothetical protein [uncultured Bdellovibrio sp.]
MKMLAVFASLLLSSVTFAQNAEVSIRTIDDEITYLSWCNDNKVVSQDINGQERVHADCSEQGLLCQSQHIVRFHQILIIASCVNPNP